MAARGAREGLWSEQTNRHYVLLCQTLFDPRYREIAGPRGPTTFLLLSTFQQQSLGPQVRPTFKKFSPNHIVKLGLGAVRSQLDPGTNTLISPMKLKHCR